MLHGVTDRPSRLLDTTMITWLFPGAEGRMVVVDGGNTPRRPSAATPPPTLSITAPRRPPLNDSVSVWCDGRLRAARRMAPAVFPTTFVIAFVIHLLRKQRNKAVSFPCWPRLSLHATQYCPLLIFAGWHFIKKFSIGTVKSGIRRERKYRGSDREVGIAGSGQSDAPKTNMAPKSLS